MMGRQITNIRFKVRWDEIYYIAWCIDVPVYAIGDTSDEAISNLEEELRELYQELSLNNNHQFSREWTNHKRTLETMME